MGSVLLLDSIDGWRAGQCVVIYWGSLDEPKVRRCETAVRCGHLGGWQWQSGEGWGWGCGHLGGLWPTVR